MKFNETPIAQATRTLLVRCATTGDALHHQRHTVLPPLARAADDAAEALAAVDTQQALALASGDAQAVTLAEQQSEQCASALDTARVAQVRQQRVEAALVGHLQTAEAELAATVPGLREAALHHGHDLMLGWNDRLQQAGVEYVKVLRQIAAEASAAGNPAVLRAVGDVVLVDLTAPASPWVSGGRVKQQDGSTLALGADAIDATLAAELSGPRRLLAEVQSYASHAQREAQRLAQRGTYAGRDSLDVAPATVVDDAPARTTTVQVPPTARRGRSPSVAARVA